MAQSPGMMNTAPSPIPGGYGNPTGMNIGLPGVMGTGGSGTPIAPMPWNSVPTSPGAANANQLPQSFFPANTGGTTIPQSLMNLTSGFGQGAGGPWYQNLYNEFGRAYGKGTGQLLGDMITKGIFNPGVAQAMMQAMEPTIQRGFNNVLGAFGSEGARFSSAGAIGAGDYMSQARLGQTAQLAQMFQQDQMAQLDLLSGAMPTLHTEEANRPSALKDIIGGLEIAGGAVLGSPSLIQAGGGMITGTSGGVAPSTGGQAGSNPFRSLYNSIFNPAANLPTMNPSVGGVSDPSLAYPGYIPGNTPNPINAPYDPMQPLPGSPDYMGAQAGGLFGTSGFDPTGGSGSAFDPTTGTIPFLGG